MESIEVNLQRSLLDQATPRPLPSEIGLENDRWVLGSLLQKAIRRSDLHWAEAAASSLLFTDRAWLWRRIVTCAFEDISFGNVGLIADVVAAANFRPQSFQMTWRLAAHCVERLVAAPKCRATNNLIELAQPALPAAHTELAHLLEQPISTVIPASFDARLSLRKRFLASVIVAYRGREFPRHQDWAREKWLSGLEAAYGSVQLSYSVRHGLRVSGLEHPIALAALWPAMILVPVKNVEDDVFPPVETIDGVPSYAFDMHTRAGDKAIRTFSVTAPNVVGVMKRLSIARQAWPRTVSRCVFDLEGGVVRRRVQDELSASLRQSAETTGFGRTPRNAKQIRKAIVEDWPLLQQHRHRAVASQGSQGA